MLAGKNARLLMSVCLFGVLLWFCSGAKVFAGVDKMPATASATYTDNNNYAHGTANITNPAAAPTQQKTGSASCAGCHQQEHKAWLLSDHAKAMAMPTSNNILADFNDTSASHYSQSAEFFIEEGVYKAKIKDLKNDRSQTFSIKYTFGHYPLQQYLVETHPKGKSGSLQVLPFAWDARPKSEGGQRWYHNYSDEAIDSNDRLHWRQPLQNWNGMCADCHSDELKRNYDPVAQTFNTQFSGINVGCVSCHGQMPKSHAQAAPVSNTIVDEVIEGKRTAVNEIDTTKEVTAAYKQQLKQGSWTFLDNVSTAVWKPHVQGSSTDNVLAHELNSIFTGIAPRDNSFMETCFACHALRAPLVDGFTANTRFLDNFTPQLITPPNYFADGQIKEEVYVYGSFLQSKMYAAGVNCLDCHNPHTMKVKEQGNGLCLQCHKASEFNVPSHVNHDMNTPAAQCVNCHMPDTVYMGVDNRRDHSFKIPRPDLSAQFDTPNACTDCHDDKSNAWAATALKQWFGDPPKLNKGRQALMQLRHGQVIGLNEHLSIIKNTHISVIDRASALELLSANAQANLQALANKNNGELAKAQTDLASALEQFLQSSEPLIKLAALKNASLLSPSQRVTWVPALLKDELRAVRIEAANALVSLPVAKQNSEAYRTAFNELLRYNKNSAWRGEGRVNQGNLALQMGNTQQAETAFKASTQIDPYFAPAYVNLADLYRTKQREDLVAAVLQEGLQKSPESADMAYAYGLHWVRTGNLSQAIQQFEHSLTLDPYNPQLAYTYVLAIDGTGNTALALSNLKTLVIKYTDKSDLINLGLHLSRKLNDRQSFEWFARLQ